MSGDGRRVVIHTGGSCLSNPGPGGWAAILTSYEGENLLMRKQFAGGEGKETTNPRMSLTAAIKGLRELKRTTTPVIVRSHCEYLTKGMQVWLSNWKSNGWKTVNRKPVENKNLWQQLDEIADGFDDIHWQWLRRHDGDRLDEEANQLARKQSLKLRRKR